MSDQEEILPADIKTKLLSFLRDEGDRFEVMDLEGLANFVAQHGTEFPSLHALLCIIEDAIGKHIERTGKVTLGIKMVRTTLQGAKRTR